MKEIVFKLLSYLLLYLCFTSTIFAQTNQPSFLVENDDNPLIEGESSQWSASQLPDNSHLFSFENDEGDSASKDLSTVLPPDAVFQFSLGFQAPNFLVARWQIAKGYYLYREKFEFALTHGGVLGEPEYPVGLVKTDIKYGQVTVYEDNLTIKLPIIDSQGLERFTVKITYQGCAEAGFCYPPLTVEKSINLDEEPEFYLAPKSQTHLAEESEVEVKKEIEKPELSWFTQIAQWFGGETGDRFLAPEQAFQFSATFTKVDTLDTTPSNAYITARWQITPGYYLYREKIQFHLLATTQATLGTPEFPPNTQKDPTGTSQVYSQSLLEVKIPVSTQQSRLTLQVKYQGCATAGFCYPPITKDISLTLNQPDEVNQSVAISESDQIANLLAHANIWYLLLMFFGFGLLLSLTPCVYPMIPILSGIIVGQGEQVTTTKAFMMSSIYVLAMSFTYAIVGVLTGLLGENLPAIFQNPWIIGAFVLIFIALALSMFGFYELQLPNRFQSKLTYLSNRQQGGTFLGVAIMGILSALIVGPCVAAPLMGALIYISQTGDAILGGFSLFAMSLGMGIPLIIVGTSAGHLLPKSGQWMETIKCVFGVLLLAVAIWMLDRIVPRVITFHLTAILLIISSVYLGAFDVINVGVSGWRRFWKGVGLIMFVYGILLMVGAAQGNGNLLQPLALKNNNSQLTTTTQATSSLSFTPIKNLAELEQQLAQAKTQHQPVMLKFSADWCVSCEELELFTFSDPQVQQQLKQFKLLKADVTANNPSDKALYQHFQIYGPPVLLFFDANGIEQRAYRIVGFISASNFNQHIQQLLQL
jgi:thiol:disulfide interchange protein DsbD